MKTFLTLILCGISCAVAMPTCENSNACDKTSGLDRSKPYYETAADLESFCNAFLEELDCKLDLIKRCPGNLLGVFGTYLEGSRKLYRRVCCQCNPLHQKYLEKASCLNNATVNAQETCTERNTGRSMCEALTQATSCVEEEVKNACGTDDEGLVTELYKPAHIWKYITCTVYTS